MNDKILSKVEKIALHANNESRGVTSTTIITLLRCLASASFLSLLVINSLGLGLGFSNMKIYHDIKSRGYFNKEDSHIHSKCFPPHNNLIKYLIPGFQLGCYIASSLKDE